MSYNIDSWKTKKIENLTIPINDLLEIITSNGITHRTVLKGLEVKSVIFELGEDDGMTVIPKDNLAIITEINLYGVRSGGDYEVLKELLEKSKGELEAVAVWEGGDSIVRLCCIDGNVTEVDVDL